VTLTAKKFPLAATASMNFRALQKPATIFLRCASQCEKSSLHATQCEKSCLMHLNATYFREMQLTARKILRDANQSKNFSPVVTACEFFPAANCGMQIYTDVCTKSQMKSATTAIFKMTFFWQPKCFF
tara:strand:- start:235 stop:618 length:384 start_codon:yes stop_codon:yes gene_type:complete